MKSIDAKEFDPSIVSPFDSTITRRYVTKKDAKSGLTLTYVDVGHFKPILYEMFPIYSIFNIIFAYSILIFQRVDTRTIFVNLVLAYVSGVGVTAGSHRLWTHRSYKASRCLEIFLALGHTIGMQFSILKWCHIHILHHKYSDTDGDPHNISRGPLFAHFGWMCARVHPILYEKAKKVNFKNLTSNPILVFQHENKNILEFIFAIFIPIAMPMYFYDEYFIYSFAFCMARIHLTQNTTALVNSAAHMFGDKPYKRDIKPADNQHVSLLTLGEGYHNYHHTFPYDYATGELGNAYNPTKIFIELMALIGLASDLRRADQENIKNIVDADKTRNQKG